MILTLQLTTTKCFAQLTRNISEKKVCEKSTDIDYGQFSFITLGRKNISGKTTTNNIYISSDKLRKFEADF